MERNVAVIKERGRPRTGMVFACIGSMHAKKWTQIRGLEEALSFPFIEALLGRRSRRFAMGAEMKTGPLAFVSQQNPLPLDEIEQMLVLLAAGGTTGWHHLLMGSPHYAPYLASYAGAAGGRTFPSSAGFHTTELFFTDDHGVYFLPTRDQEAIFRNVNVENFSLDDLIEAHRKRIRKIRDGRLVTPRRAPHMEGHNFWIANHPGSTLVIPVTDVAQHFLANLCYFLQSGFIVYDDYNKCPIPGLDQFSAIADLDNPYPLSYVEQITLMEATVEMSTSCYAGVLMLQALGLGGWMYNGIDRHAIFGISGDPEAPGLGFESVSDERWTLPNPIRLQGVLEAMCPPNYPDMRSTVEALAKRKFGPGGPFHGETPGVWKDSQKVRTSAQQYTEEFKDCVTLQAQYVYDTFGKIPATSPSLVCMMYLQAHHLDLDFYDQHFEPGAYLRTHRDHLHQWHPGLKAIRKKAS